MLSYMHFLHAVCTFTFALSMFYMYNVSSVDIYPEKCTYVL